MEKHPISSLKTVQMETPASERKLVVGRKCVRKSPLYRGGKKVPVTSDYYLRLKCKLDGLSQNLEDEQDDPNNLNSLARPSAGNLSKPQRKPLNK